MMIQNYIDCKKFLYITLKIVNKMSTSTIEELEHAFKKYKNNINLTFCFMFNQYYFIHFLIKISNSEKPQQIKYVSVAPEKSIGYLLPIYNCKFVDFSYEARHIFEIYKTRNNNIFKFLKNINVNNFRYIILSFIPNNIFMNCFAFSMKAIFYR